MQEFVLTYPHAASSGEDDKYSLTNIGGGQKTEIRRERERKRKRKRQKEEEKEWQEWEREKRNNKWKRQCPKLELSHLAMAPSLSLHWEGVSHLMDPMEDPLSFWGVQMVLERRGVWQASGGPTEYEMKSSILWLTVQSLRPTPAMCCIWIKTISIFRFFSPSKAFQSKWRF